MKNIQKYHKKTYKKNIKITEITMKKHIKKRVKKRVKSYITHAEKNTNAPKKDRICYTKNYYPRSSPSLL